MAERSGSLRALSIKARRLGLGQLRRNPRRQAEAVRKSIHLLDSALPRGTVRLALTEQPFDSLLLKLSPLYRLSRARYVEGGGTFVPSLVSSPRTLGSAILLEQRIEYSPIQSEMIWAAQQGSSDYLLQLRTHLGSPFHEQNHRVLWRFLPPPPRSVSGVRKYLNFAESLVIATDMALGDALGEDLAAVFYLVGSIYDPGTSLRDLCPKRRDYRNYLHACAYATYLNLELYDPAKIPIAVEAQFPMLEGLARRAAARSGLLDRGFIMRTNVGWQRKHGAKVFAALARKGEAPLDLPDDPMDQRVQYFLAERWFDSMGL